MDLPNVGILPEHYTASQPGRPRLETVDDVCDTFILVWFTTLYI